MPNHPLAGRPAPPDVLIDVEKLRREYYDRRPDPADPAQRVKFGTSGHRGSAENGAFNVAHILAITDAIVRYRRGKGIAGPLFLGRDTHALSEPAFRTALEVLAAAGVDVMVDAEDGYTPTPAISRAILVHNQASRGAGASSQADGIVVTPSHNPPADGGFKYNPPDGGPAGTDVTRWIEDAANRRLESGVEAIPRLEWEKARRAPTTHGYDYVGEYVDDLGSVVDLELVRVAGLKVGVDPLGGASVAFWRPIADRYRLDLEVVNDRVDPTFRFMTLDWDGKIRMDCSSPFAMANLIALKDRFDVAFGNDADADRHGIVTPAGLMNPNHYLAAAISHLFAHRPEWRRDAAVGKTIVSSSVIDRVAARAGRRLVEVPVGFKWFVAGLLDGSLGFGGEESAGASLLRRDGTVWTTDKDGIVMDLLALEITARSGKDPSELYAEITREVGGSVYERIDAPATPEQKAALAKLSPADVSARRLAGDPIESILTSAPGNGAPIGGLKVATAQGWFAARPSGTEDVTKLYAESFRGVDHLRRIQEEARALLDAAATGAKS